MVRFEANQLLTLLLNWAKSCIRLLGMLGARIPNGSILLGTGVHLRIKRHLLYLFELRKEQLRASRGAPAADDTSGVFYGRP